MKKELVQIGVMNAKIVKNFVMNCGKNMLDVCCDLTPYETNRWLELKPDRERT